MSDSNSNLNDDNGNEATKLEVSKDQTNFSHLCKDLFRFIRRKIIKNYVVPDFPNSTSQIPNPWFYHDTQENLTPKDKTCNIFKDDTFLPLVQKCYEALENIITRIDENRKKVELYNKNIEMDQKKLKLLNELNTHLNTFFTQSENNANNANNANNSNNSNGDNKDKVFEHLSLAKTITLLNDIQKINKMNSANLINMLGSNENNDKDNNIINKCDNIKDTQDNTDLTCDYSEDGKSNNKSSFLGQKRELNFDSILEAEKINVKNGKIEVKISSSKKILADNNIIFQNEQEISKSQLEFEKILKTEFSAVYTSSLKNNLSEQNKEYIQKIKNILKAISSIKFPQAKNKFENPCLVGSHKLFEIKYLLNSIPSIDILFKCKVIKNIEELEKISEQTMKDKLKLDYVEICKAYDKASEIIKLTNKCKININDNISFIYINLFFVDIQNSNYIDMEKCFLKYLSKNELYGNEDIILICLFFRRWRRKFQLFFIMPEYLDVIVNLYYKNFKTKNIALIIENLFFDLSNNQINYYNLKGNSIMCSFIKEWYNIPENQEALKKAISVTNEYLLKGDFLSLVKFD